MEEGISNKPNENIYVFELGQEKWVYDFENMGIEQALTCETLFRLHEQVFKVLPSNPDDSKVIMDQMNLRQAYAALLMKEVSDGVYAEFNTNMAENIDALKLMKAKDKLKLEVCRKDFFSRCNIGSNELIESLQTLMSLIKGMPEGVQSLFLNGMFAGIQEKIGTNYDQNSITEVLKKSGLDNGLTSSQSG